MIVLLVRKLIKKRIKPPIAAAVQLVTVKTPGIMLATQTRAIAGITQKPRIQSGISQTRAAPKVLTVKTADKANANKSTSQNIMANATDTLIACTKLPLKSMPVIIGSIYANASAESSILISKRVIATPPLLNFDFVEGTGAEISSVPPEKIILLPVPAVKDDLRSIWFQRICK